MANLKPHYCSFEELCAITALSSDVIIEIVEHGIIEPKGTHLENWTFNTQMITVTKKACRLHKDLGIDWPGIALAINLLDELEQLRTENQQLHNRLNRFTTESN
ncbi:MAG: chaperone modulatory protein CbpM [Gammaproteobacteria bacterium]|nr:chaperone modulatory protein CbpM [Gammaproteobacteria bacterium]